MSQTSDLFRGQRGGDMPELTEEERRLHDPLSHVCLPMQVKPAARGPVKPLNETNLPEKMNEAATQSSVARKFYSEQPPGQRLHFRWTQQQINSERETAAKCETTYLSALKQTQDVEEETDSFGAEDR